MELDLIKSFKTELEKDTEEDYERWKKERLISFQEFKKRNRRIINKYDGKVRSKIVAGLINMYWLGQEKFYQLAEAAKAQLGNIFISPNTRLVKTLETLQRPSIEPKFFRINDYKFNALIESIENDFNEANAAVLRQMDDVYRQTLFKTQVHYNTGQVTLQQAIDESTKDFREKGIDAIVYSDGKRVNIASYAEMAIRTANHRAYLMGEGKKRQEMGLAWVVVSAHATACELCAPWQGLVLIDDVYTLDENEAMAAQLEPPEELNYEPRRLSEAMEAGLLHPNCRHNLSTYFPGITTLPEIPDPLEVLRNYEAEQRQRYIERQIRKYKRLKEGAISQADQKRYSAYMRRWQKVMRDFLKGNPQLRRAYHREKLY